MKLTKLDLLMIAIVILLALLVVYPLIMIMVGSFKEGGPLIRAPYGFSGYVRAFTDIRSFTTLWTTLWLALVKSVLCLIVAVFLAWVVTRTDTPGRSWIEIGMWLLMFLPGTSLVMSWILLGSAPNGLINVAIMKIFPLLF